jgi:hypothetical protein
MKFFRDSKGNVSMFFLVIFSAILIAESIFVQGLNGISEHQQIDQILNTRLRSFFAEYDGKLASYGIYAVRFPIKNSQRVLKPIRNHQIDKVRIASSELLEDDFVRQILSEMKFEITNDLVNRIVRNTSNNFSNQISRASQNKQLLNEYKDNFDNFATQFNAFFNTGNMFFSSGDEKILIKHMLDVEQLIKFEGYFFEKYNHVLMFGDEWSAYRTKLSELHALLKSNPSSSLTSDSMNDCHLIFTKFNNTFRLKNIAQKKSEKEIGDKIKSTTSSVDKLLYSCKNNSLPGTKIGNHDPNELKNEAFQALKIIDLLPRKITENALISEYAIQKFTYRTFVSSADNAFRYPHLLNNSEVETILTGEKDCSSAQSKVTMQLFLLRFAVHFVEALVSSKNVLFVSNPSIELLKIILKSSEQALVELRRLFKGEEIAFSKLFWKNLKLDYKGYLRLLMYAKSNKIKTNRIKYLIQSNTKSEFNVYRVSANLRIQVTSKYKSRYSLLDDKDEYDVAFHY